MLYGESMLWLISVLGNSSLFETVWIESPFENFIPLCGGFLGLKTCLERQETPLYARVSGGADGKHALMERK